MILCQFVTLLLTLRHINLILIIYTYHISVTYRHLLSHRGKNAVNHYYIPQLIHTKSLWFLLSLTILATIIKKSLNILRIAKYFLSLHRQTVVICHIQKNL